MFFNIFVKAIHFTCPPEQDQVGKIQLFHRPFFVFATRPLFCCSIAPNYLADPHGCIAAKNSVSYRLALESSTAQFTYRLSFASLKFVKSSDFEHIIFNCSNYLQTLEIKHVNNFMVDLHCIVKYCKRLKNLIICDMHEKQLLQQLVSPKPLERYECDYGEDGDTTVAISNPCFEHRISRLNLTTNLVTINSKKTVPALQLFFTRFSEAALRPLTHINLNFNTASDTSDSASGYQYNQKKRNDINSYHRHHEQQPEANSESIYFTPLLTRIAARNFNSLLSLKINFKIPSVQFVGIQYIKFLPRLKILHILTEDSEAFNNSDFISMFHHQTTAKKKKMKIMQYAPKNKNDDDDSDDDSDEDRDEYEKKYFPKEDDQGNNNNERPIFPALEELILPHCDFLDLDQVGGDDNIKRQPNKNEKKLPIIGDKSNTTTTSNNHLKSLRVLEFRVSVESSYQLRALKQMPLFVAAVSSTLFSLTLNTHSLNYSTLEENPYDHLSQLKALRNLTLNVSHHEARDGPGLFTKGKAPPFLHRLEVTGFRTPFDFHNKNGIPHQISCYMPAQEECDKQGSDGLVELIFSGQTDDLYDDMFKIMFDAKHCTFAWSLETLRVNIYQTAGFKMCSEFDFLYLGIAFAPHRTLKHLHWNCFPVVDFEKEEHQKNVKPLAVLADFTKDIRICQRPRDENEAKLIPAHLREKFLSHACPVPKVYLDVIYGGNAVVGRFAR